MLHVLLFIHKWSIDPNDSVVDLKIKKYLKQN